MTGYNRIAKQNPKINFYNILSSICFPIFGKKLEAILKKKKILFIQKSYPTFSFQIKRVLDHTATTDEVVRLYEVGIPLIDDYMICLKKENYLTKECLNLLERWESAQTDICNRESDYAAILDIILACRKKNFSSGWDAVGAYCLGFLTKEQTLLEIRKMRLQIPKTIKLIEAQDKDILKIEEVYHKETKLSS